MESVPLKPPEVWDLNITLMVHFTPAASVRPQLFDCKKHMPVKLLQGPATIFEIASAAVPVLLNVTGAGALGNPIVAAIVKLVGETETRGAGALALLEAALIEFACKIALCAPGMLDPLLSTPPPHAVTTPSAQIENANHKCFFIDSAPTADGERGCRDYALTRIY